MPTIPVYQKFKLNLSDSVTCSESFEKKTFYNLSDSTDVSDSILKKTSYSLIDNLDVSDSILKKIAYGLSDNLTVSDVFAKKMFIEFLDTINISDSISFVEFVLEKGLRKDISNIIDEYGENVTLYSQSETLDSSGGIIANTETSDTGVKVIIQDIVAEDYNLLGKGIDYTGTAKLFAKYRYDLTNNGNNYKIKPGDRLERIYYTGTDKYTISLRVEELIREVVQESVVIYYEYLVRLIDVTRTSDATTPSSGLESGVRADVSNIFDERAEKITLESISTTLDSMGGITAETSTKDTNVKVLIQDISAKDRKILGEGINYTGLSKMFARWSYDLTNHGNNYQIKIGDFITSVARNCIFRVETIVSKDIVNYGSGFMEYIVRRMDNENLV